MRSFSKSLAVGGDESEYIIEKYILKDGSAISDPRGTSSCGIIQAGDTILFQGDSITNAFRRPDEQNNAYRMGAGYALLIASHLMADHPGAGLNFINTGVAGHKVSDLAAGWQESCLAYKPDVLSLLIGVNDMLGGTPSDQFAETYRNLLKRTFVELPELRLVLCEPFVLPSNDMIKPEYLDNMPKLQRVARNLADEFGAVFVPLQSAFDEAARQSTPQYWSYDGIHPTAPGFELIARQWIRSVTKKS
jgi:lysophospholipase L1-like esterase